MPHGLHVSSRNRCNGWSFGLQSLAPLLSHSLEVVKHSARTGRRLRFAAIAQPYRTERGTSGDPPRFPGSSLVSLYV